MTRSPRSPLATWSITTGAAVLLFLTVVGSTVFLMMSRPTQAELLPWLAPSGSTVWHQGRVWTLVTGPLIELSFLSLVLQAIILWQFVPQMERHWGTPRLLRFALLASLLGSLAGSLVSLLRGVDTATLGGGPFVVGLLVAFGVLFAKHPVALFGAVNMTAKQLAIGMSAVLVLAPAVDQRWEQVAALLAAIGFALLMTHRQYNPRVLYKRWQLRRARAHLKVVDAPRKKRPTQEYLN